MLAVAPDKITMTENGMIALPDHIRQTVGFAPGDELLMLWLPPDTIIIRKFSEIVAHEDFFAMAMLEFDQALRFAGYETDEEVRRLVQAVKQEQFVEWVSSNRKFLREAVNQQQLFACLTPVEFLTKP